MAYQALYRKYRPSKFSDVVDQENILKIITNSLKTNKISHAYLFFGPRGTGKTTIAKLLAKTINCQNLNSDYSVCLKCSNCVDIENNSSDIIEIDAASNNGVDEIRELKSKINLVPNSLKYKVYIIDEVHMLSISAFNALLKTLEEPPSHVIFILATTEFYKVPSTIISRCQCLNFNKIKNTSIEKRLLEISELEKINITKEAIQEIALYSDGGMRDAIGMLDKMASYSLDVITLEDFQKINGLISKKDITELINNILNNNKIEVINTIDDLNKKGYDFSKIIEKILEQLRDLIVDHYVLKNDVYDPNKLYSLLMCFNDINNSLKDSFNRKIVLEVKLLKYMNENLDIKKEVKNDISQEINNNCEIVKNDLSKQIKKENIQKEILKTNYTIDFDIKNKRINNTFATANKELKQQKLLKWNDLKKYIIDSKYSIISGLLIDCDLSVVGVDNIILTTKYESLIDKIYTNFLLVEELISKIFEHQYKVVVLTVDEFEIEVNKYKKYKKDNNYYQYILEEKPLIIFQSLVENTNKICYGNLVDKAIKVFGNDIVEIE